MSEIAVAEPGTRLQKFLDRAGLRGFPWKTAIILYTISWCWMFIVRDSYWTDDWNWFPEHSKPFPYQTIGLPPWFEFEAQIVRLIGTSSFKVITFCSFFCAAIFLFGISQKFKLLNQVERKFLILLFLLLPFNTSRVALYVFHYTLAYFYFFSAWYLVVTFKPIWLKTLGISLFFLSFQMHSLLAFYVIPVLHLFFLSENKNLREIFYWTRRNIILISLPIIYWILREIYWPSTSYYHDLTVKNLSGTLDFIVVTGLVLLSLYLLQKWVSVKNKSAVQIILLGASAVFFGLIAYVIYGFFLSDRSIISKYFVTFLGRSDWYSRHQTLQPLGIALLIVGVITLLPEALRRLSKQIRVSILVICVILNTGFGFEYVVDYAKQKEIVAELKEFGNARPVREIQFIDMSANLNARGRYFRVGRDWDGLVWLAYGVLMHNRTNGKVINKVKIETRCRLISGSRLVLIQGPETHWEALKNWVSDGDMGFKVTVDDTPGACKPEMVTSERTSGAIPILFYFTGVKD